MTPGERTALTQIVERTKAINAEVQALKWEAKELAESAWDKAGVRPKVVKQLAKEAAWDQVKREEQRQHEEALDQCRAALGLLADLPLGQAAQEREDHQAEQPTKRRPGRPKGARNKPKLATADGEAVPPPPDVPDVPDLEAVA
jgi:uncharacterized protein (UPF0335 family)